MAEEKTYKVHYDQEEEYNASTFYSQHTLDLRADGTCTLLYVYHYDDTHGQGFFKPRFVDEMYGTLFKNEQGRYTYLELEWTGTYYIANPKELVEKTESEVRARWIVRDAAMLAKLRSPCTLFPS